MDVLSHFASLDAAGYERHSTSVILVMFHFVPDLLLDENFLLDID